MNSDGYKTFTDNLTVPRDSDVLIRQSTINSMELCAARVGYRDTEGYLDPFGEPLIFGSLVHELIALAITEQDVLETVLSVEHILDAILETQYDIDPNKILSFSHKLAEGGMVGEAQFALTEWWKWWEREHVTQPVAEQEMYAQLGTLPDGRILWLYGTPDLYSVESQKAYDWKTARRGWTLGKANYMIQASLYSHLIHQNTGVLIEDWEFLVFNRSKGVWATHVTQRNEQQIEAAKKIAWYRGLMVADGIYPATPIITENFKTKRGWYCSPKFCPAWNICEFKYIADAINEKSIKSTEL